MDFWEALRTAAFVFVVGILGFVWIVLDNRDLKRREAEYRRQRAIYEAQMKALLGIEPERPKLKLLRPPKE